MDEKENQELRAIKFFKKIHQLKRNFQNFRSVKMENKEISKDQFMIMFMLSHKGKMKVSEISDNIGLSISTISGILDIMEEKNMVERVRSKEDRRVVHIELQEEYRHLVESMKKEMERNMGRVMSKMSEEDINTVYRAIDILNEAFMEEGNDASIDQ